MIAFSESERNMYNHVKVLTHTEKPRNYENTDILNYCANYIEDELKKCNCDIISSQYFSVDYKEIERDPITQLPIQPVYLFDYKSMTYNFNPPKKITITRNYKNIIASFNVQAEERIVIGAHYDVCGDQNGANDNASGVAGAIELARKIGKIQDKLKYRIDIVFYANEEPPNFASKNMGSYIHAKYLKDNNIKVKAMIALDCIGYYTDKMFSQKYPSFLLNLILPNTGNFIAYGGVKGTKDILKGMKKATNEVSDIKVVASQVPQGAVSFSDNMNYTDFGYNAILVTDTAFYRSDNYHTEDDTIDTLDFHRMGQVVNGVFNYVKKENV